jgi:RHS repeat-associated protein
VYDTTTGSLATRTDPNGAKVTYTYDAFGNVRRELHQASDDSLLKDVGGTSGATYDSLGRPISRTEVVSGRIQSWTYPVDTAGGVQETLAYDASPLTSTTVDRGARGVEASRETSVASGLTLTRSVADTSSGRDQADRWTSASLQLTGFGALTLGRSFDNAGRMATQSGAGLASAGSYSYNATSGLKTRQDLPLALGGRVEDNYTYGSDGRLQSWSVGPAATPTPMATYAYDAAGNLAGDGTTTFAYSTSGTPNRLVSSTTGGATTVYGWDQANAWRTSQGPSGTPNQVQYTYTKPAASTSNGRMTRFQNAATSTDVSYVYDASGQRTQSTSTVAGTTTTTDFTYDGLTLLKVSATQGSSSWRIDYLYDEEGTLYGGVYRSPATQASPTVFSVITNDHGDVLELLDAHGAAFAAYRYDPWGKPVASGTTTCLTSLIGSSLAADIAARQVLRYASYAYDAESGLYYCSARYYDPATRQWTTGDPAKADGEESTYQYCGGEPIGAADSTGAYVIRQDWHATPANFTFTVGKNKVYQKDFQKFFSVTAQLRYHRTGKKWTIDEFAFFNITGATSVVSMYTYAVIQERMRDGSSAWTGRWSPKPWGREDISGMLFYNPKTKQTDITPYYVSGINASGRMKYVGGDGTAHVGTRLYVKHQMQWGGFTSHPGWAGYYKVYLSLPQTEAGAKRKNVTWMHVSRFGSY